MASGDRYYCLTALPAPGDLGSAPPVTTEQLLEMVSGMRDVHRLLEALFLQDDLVQREAFLSGEITEIEPAVLTLRQAKNEEPLPSYLVLAEERDHFPELICHILNRALVLVIRNVEEKLRRGFVFDHRLR